MDKQDTLKPGGKDDVRQAAASGEPGVSGRSHGRIIDEQGRAAGAPEQAEGNASTSREHNDNTSGKSGKVSQATESGRQRATD